MIQTKVRTNHLIGFILLIEPKLTIRPNGKANTNVSRKSSTVVPNPSSRALVTVKNIR